MTGDEIFRIQPKSYLAIGNLAQMKGSDERFTCFQLFRSSLTAPEILTYDELYERAKCIVETIGGKRPQPGDSQDAAEIPAVDSGGRAMSKDLDEIPF